jgi:hypothetical protein
MTASVRNASVRTATGPRGVGTAIDPSLAQTRAGSENRAANRSKRLESLPRKAAKSVEIRKVVVHDVDDGADAAGGAVATIEKAIAAENGASVKNVEGTAEANAVVNEDAAGSPSKNSSASRSSRASEWKRRNLRRFRK